MDGRTNKEERDIRKQNIMSSLTLAGKEDIITDVWCPASVSRQQSL